MAMIRNTARLISGIFILLFAAGPASAEENWSRWRGPQGNGHSTETNLPVRWSSESVAWKTPLPGTGQSSPIVWGDRIFLTSARDNGRERIVCCVDARDGKMIWEHVAWTGEPEKIHEMNS